MNGKKGDRIQVTRCNDPFVTNLVGEIGTILIVDDMGTRHVEFDNGSTLGLIPNEDGWIVLDDAE